MSGGDAYVVLKAGREEDALLHNYSTYVLPHAASGTLVQDLGIASIRLIWHLGRPEITRVYGYQVKVRNTQDRDWERLLDNLQADRYHWRTRVKQRQLKMC